MIVQKNRREAIRYDLLTICWFRMLLSSVLSKPTQVVSLQSPILSLDLQVGLLLIFAKLFDDFRLDLMLVSLTYWIGIILVFIYRSVTSSIIG